MSGANVTGGGWIVCWKPQPQPRLRLFCLPHAGGGASAYRRWGGLLPPAIEVCAVQLPGRESRFHEPPYTRLGPLIAALAQALPPLLDRPFVLFGHSMGALLAVELAHALTRLGAPAPARVIASGARPPSDPRTDPPIHALERAAFLEKIRALGGTPAEVLAHRELLDLVLPTLRADFELLETSPPRRGEPLACPLTVLGGESDDGVPSSALEGWRLESRGPVSVRTLPGGHFYLHDAPGPFLAVLAEEALRGLPIEQFHSSSS